MDAKVTPAWRWSHSASACTQDPKHGPTLLPSLHIPLPNNRTPHLRCGKGPSNSTTSETEAVTPHSPTPTQPEASHSSGCAQHAKVALLASQVQPRLALPTAAAEGPIAPPPASPAGPYHCWTNGALSLGLPSAPSPQSGLHKLAPASPSGVLPAPTPIPRWPHISLSHDQVHAASHPHSTPSQATSLRGAVQADEGLPPQAAHEKPRSPC